MSDISWLRGFQRSRTSAGTLPPAPNTAPISLVRNSSSSNNNNDGSTDSHAVAAEAALSPPLQQQQQQQQTSPSRFRGSAAHRVSNMLHRNIGSGGGGGDGIYPHHLRLSSLGGTSTPIPTTPIATTTTATTSSSSPSSSVLDVIDRAQQQRHQQPQHTRTSYRHGYDAVTASTTASTIGAHQQSQQSQTWHNPNLLQMVETLQAAMMSKRDALSPIPVVYNSYVLALIEGFARLTSQLRAAGDELAELRNLRERELEQFRVMSEEWIRREEGYKAEVRRLEVVLARESRDGVASVALARHATLVDRREGKRFLERLKRMSGSGDGNGGGEEGGGIIEETVEPEQENNQRRSDLAEVTSYYKTIGMQNPWPRCDSLAADDGSPFSEAIPRILDPHNDVMMSRLVEKREREDRRWTRDQMMRKNPPAPLAAPVGFPRNRQARRKSGNSIPQFQDEPSETEKSQHERALDRRTMAGRNDPDHAESQVRVLLSPPRPDVPLRPSLMEDTMISRGHSDTSSSVTVSDSSTVEGAPEVMKAAPDIRLLENPSTKDLARQMAHVSARHTTNGQETDNLGSDATIEDVSRVVLNSPIRQPAYSTTYLMLPKVPSNRPETIINCERTEGYLAHPGMTRQPRNRVYSFVQGDDEILPVAHPVETSKFSPTSSASVISEEAPLEYTDKSRDAVDSSVQDSTIEHVTSPRPLAGSSSAEIEVSTMPNFEPTDISDRVTAPGSLEQSKSRDSVVWVGGEAGNMQKNVSDLHSTHAPGSMSSRASTIKKSSQTYSCRGSIPRCSCTIELAQSQSGVRGISKTYIQLSPNSGSIGGIADTRAGNKSPAAESPGIAGITTPRSTTPLEWRSSSRLTTTLPTSTPDNVATT